MATRGNGLNATIAFWVVAKEATLEHLVWMMNATPANLVVVSYDVWLDERTAAPYQVANAMNTAVEEVKQGEQQWKAAWSNFGGRPWEDDARLGCRLDCEDRRWPSQVIVC